MSWIGWLVVAVLFAGGIFTAPFGIIPLIPAVRRVHDQGYTRRGRAVIVFTAGTLAQLCMIAGAIALIVDSTSAVAITLASIGLLVLLAEVLLLVFAHGRGHPAAHVT
jgi:hypothetical protein